MDRHNTLGDKRLARHLDDLAIRANTTGSRLRRRHEEVNACIISNLQIPTHVNLAAASSNI